MRKKIIGIFICMLMICGTLTTILYSNNIKVEASGGGQQNGQGAIGLDYQFLWNMSKNFSDVVYKADWNKNYNGIPGHGIPRGREWATEGENYTISHILRRYMNGSGTLCNLSDYREIPIGSLGDGWGYSSKEICRNFNLTINNPDYPFPKTMPLSEVFPFPAGYKDWLTGNTDVNYTFTNEVLWPKNATDLWPFGGTFTNCYMNVSYVDSTGVGIIGNAVYLTNSTLLPSDQEGCVFIINDSAQSQSIIDNMTNASGLIVVTGDRGMTQVNCSRCNFSVGTVNHAATNFSDIIALLQSGEEMMVDDMINRDILTFTYNLSNAPLWPENDFIMIDRIPTPSELSNMTLYYLGTKTGSNIVGYTLALFAKTDWCWLRNKYQKNHPNLGGNCTGVIMYDSFDTHFMAPSTRNWFNYPHHPWPDNPALPIFSINFSAGNWIRQHYTTTTISGFFDQVFKQQILGDGVVSYDVIGYRNDSHNPTNELFIINNRMDGFDAQAPGDSGVGGAVALGIAKYMNDFQIKPRRNMAFLFTTGEEYGCRGNWYYHNYLGSSKDNVKMFFAFDQIGLNQKNTQLGITFNNNILKRKLWEILNQSHYDQRSGYPPTVLQNSLVNGSGGEDEVWMHESQCDAFCFAKDPYRKWTGYQRAGQDYTEGDVLSGIDRNDTNLSLELAWNVTKYFCVNPNCWFNNKDYQAVDSTGGTIPDSLKTTFTVNSVLPSDLVLVNASLYDASTHQLVPDGYQEINLVINRTGVERNVTFSMPPAVKEGDYYIKLEVYNSTARINRTLQFAYHSNDTETSPTFHLNKYHTLGDIRIGTSNQNVHNVIRASKFTLTEDALVHNITAYLYGCLLSAPTYQCMIYRVSDGHLMGSTGQTTPYTIGWDTFSFNSKPILSKNTQYLLSLWGNNDNSMVYYTALSYGNGYFNNSYTFGSPPQNIGWSMSVFLRQYSIFCRYTLNLPPEIVNVSHSPDEVGFGYNVTINANVTDDYNNITSVKVNITYPDHTYGNYSMSRISGSHYRYVFTTTWLVGQYNYTIWAADNASNVNSSTGHHFHVSAEAKISIATLKDSYTGNQYINITDPPNPPENYTLIGRGLTWNTYYDASSGNNILEVYQGPTNYQENNGSWTPINNSFYSLPSNHPAYSYGYRMGNTHGLFGVYFKPDSSSSWPVAFAYNKSSNPTISVIRSKLVGVGYLDPQNNWAYHYLQNVQSSQGQTNSNTITYPSVFTGTDVSWSYRNTELKEAITMSNTTKTLLQNHPPSLYGLNDASSYLVFITKLDYQNLNLYNTSGLLTGNVTISETGVDFKDALGQFKCGLPIGEAWEKNNESVREKLTYRVVHLSGDTYLLSGLRVSDLNAMIFPVVIDPTLTVYSRSSDGHINKSDSNYNTARTASSGTVSNSASFLSIGQVKNTSGTPSKTYTVYRGFVFFNTSLLPSNAYLDSANLSLYKKDDFSATDFDITIQNGQPTYPHEPMQSGDYNLNYYSGNGGTLNTRNLQNGYNKISLTNLNWINRNGITKLCLRSSREINANAPTGNEYVNVYANEQGIGYQPKLVITYRNQSKIKNTGSTNIKGYLLIQVQFYNTTQGKWLVDKDTINETSPRAITSGNQLALDTIFNGHVRASDLTHGAGTYRLYAAFRNPNGNILKTSSGVWLNAWWQFTKT